MRSIWAIAALGLCWTTEGGLANTISNSSNAERAHIRSMIGAFIARRSAEQTTRTRCTLPLSLVATGSLNARSAETQIARLREEIAKRAKSEAALRVQLTDERARLAKYMTSSDARLAEIKSALKELSVGIAADQRAARQSIARDIVKSRQHRRALRSLASTQKKLKLAQGAASPKAAPSTSSGASNVAAKPRKRKPRNKPQPAPFPSFWDD